MSALAVALGSFVLVFGAALVGMAIRGALPDHHVADASKDVVNRAIALVVTLTALVLGFLVGSARGYYDEVHDDLERLAADSIVLDRAMARYGPETAGARERLRQAIGIAVQRLWPEDAAAAPAAGTGGAMSMLDEMEGLLRALAPQSDTQRALQSRALQVAGEMSQASWRLVELSRTRIQTPFLVIQVLWLMIIFLGFGLFAPRNATVVAALLFSSLAACAAIFMILEMYDPTHGLMRIPRDTLEVPLGQLGR